MTSVKPEHLPHVAIQAHVLRGAGITVRRTELMHLSRACRHPDLSNLFEREDVGAEVGDHCHEPHDCPFLKRCWPEPPPHAIETLYRKAPRPARGVRGRGIPDPPRSAG